MPLFQHFLKKLQVQSSPVFITKPTTEVSKCVVGPVILHEICGEVARLHQPGDVGAALAVAFSASGEDVGMVVTTTASPREDTPHAEARAMIEGLVALMGGMTGWSDPREGGLTLRVRLPHEGRSLQ